VTSIIHVVLTLSTSVTKIFLVFGMVGECCSSRSKTDIGMRRFDSNNPGTEGSNQYED